MKIKINVTARDIKLGDKGESQSCPVARAISRRMPGVRVLVKSSVFFIGVRQVYMPDSVQHWIRCFDTSELVEPFSFQLELP